MILKGKGVSSGIGIGHIRLYEKFELTIPYYRIEDPEAEIERFQTARRNVIRDIDVLYEKMLKEHADEAAEVFSAHREILEDGEGFINPVCLRIREEKDNAAFAVAFVLNGVADMFRSMDSEYMRERAADAEDLRDSVNAKILGVKKKGIAARNEKCIVAAYDLAPSDTAGMDFSTVEGLLTETGGPTSHTAIMSRTMEIPAVVGAQGLLEYIHDGDMAIINGETGEIIIKPDREQIECYVRLQQEYRNQSEELRRYAGVPSVTCDGHRVRLEANVGTEQDVSLAAGYDAEGIGLVRTEFLYMKRHELPSEQEQFEVYRSILESMGNRPVIFRTLDAGGDKELPALGLTKEDNPFLGFRAIRICLQNPDLFKTQLRALLKASIYGECRIMFPMISSINEVRKAKGIVEEVKVELASEGIPYKEDVPVGIMVEIPSVAVMAEAFASEADFFSIGTNDLVQYTLAADRGNPKLSEISTVYHPAVLNLIAAAIRAAAKYNIPCGMCGEAASDIKLIPLFLGIGLNEFSMSASSILKVRKLISGLSYETCRKLADEVLKLKTDEDIRHALDTAKIEGDTL